MSDVHAPGRQVIAQINSNDLSSATPLVFYDVSTKEILSLGAGEVFVIYLISISNGDSAAVVTVFDDADGDNAVDAGETLFKKSMNAAELAGYALVRGFAVKRVPKVIASGASANSSITIHGDFTR